MVVVYGNGVRDNLDVDRLIRPNEESGLLELRGHRGRFIDRIILLYRDARPGGPSAEVEVWARSTRNQSVGVGPPQFGPNWDRLGTKIVDRDRDRDVFELNRGDGRFDALRLRVLDNDVRVTRMEVKYGNGVSHALDVDRRISAGGSSDVIDLRGVNGRVIDRVLLFYETAGRGPRSTVELWGRSPRG